MTAFSELVDELNRRAAALEADAAKLRAAAAVLLDDSSPSMHGYEEAPRRVREEEVRPVPASAPAPEMAPASSRGEMLPLLRSVLQAEGPLPYRDLTERMLAAGWETASKMPANTVRTALGRLMERGEVARTADGDFDLLSSAGQR